MKKGSKNFWARAFVRILAMSLIVPALTLVAGCGQQAEEDDKTVTVFQPVVAPSDSGAPSVSPNGSPSESEEILPDGNGADDAITVVSSKDVVGPCVGGVQEVTHTTTYSNGTMASSISMQPCDEAAPDIAPVPAD